MGALIAARAKRLMLLRQPVRPLASNVMKENLHCLVHENVFHVQKGRFLTRPDPRLAIFVLGPGMKALLGEPLPAMLQTIPQHASAERPFGTPGKTRSYMKAI